MRNCATTVIPEAHVGIVPRWLRLCTWWSCEACSRRCSCRTSLGAPSPERHLRQQFMQIWRNPHHSWEILDYLLPMLLDAHSGRIPGWNGCFIERAMMTSQRTNKETNLLGWASWLPTTAAMLGFLLSPTGGWVTSAPRKITCARKGVTTKPWNRTQEDDLSIFLIYSPVRWKPLVWWMEPEWSSLLPVSHWSEYKI